MVTIAWLTDAVITFLRDYGYVALFIFAVLETSFILHFVPSEVVIPVAAALLVTGPTGFALFVVVVTLGAVIGSLLAYYIFGVYGDRVIDRYGHVLYVPGDEIERSKAWFRRWGEGLMFWGRLVPVVRTPISIPAGFARMDRRRFLLYSTPGWFVYNVALVWLVYDGGGGQSPLGAAVVTVRDLTASSPLAVAVGSVVLAAVAGVGWHHRKRFVPENEP